MQLTLGFVTDLHFGPRAFFGGKLRKLSHEAGALAREAVRSLNEVVAPDLVVNLGDDIEDESRDADLARYEECQAILRTARAPLINVAGNHDTVHLGRADLARIWGREGPLYYAFDFGGARLVVLHTVERKDVDVRIDDDQLAWLGDELRATSLPVIVLMHHSATDQDLADNRWFSRAPHIALVKERRALRSILEGSGKVRLVVNGHLHRNHLDVIRGIPYVTVQSLIENLDDDAPGRPAGAHAFARIDDRRIVFRVLGQDPARYQIDLLARRARVKSHTEYLFYETKKRREYIDITGTVEAILARSGIAEGMCLVSAMHITAGVYVNDHEDGLIADIDDWLDGLAPFGRDYRHHRTGEDNGDAHLKSMLVHHQIIAPVTASKLDFGPWQRIYYAEFDGRRKKRVVVKIIGE